MIPGGVSKLSVSYNCIDQIDGSEVELGIHTSRYLHTRASVQDYRPMIDDVLQMRKPRHRIRRHDEGQTFTALLPGEHQLVLSAVVMVRQARHVLLPVIPLLAQMLFCKSTRTAAQGIELTNQFRIILMGFHERFVGLPAEPRIDKGVIGVNVHGPTARKLR
jgi:hypothetical protein